MTSNRSRSAGTRRPRAASTARRRFLAPSLAAAQAAGVSVTFDVYPRHSSARGRPGERREVRGWLHVSRRRTRTCRVHRHERAQHEPASQPAVRRRAERSAARCGAFWQPATTRSRPSTRRSSSGASGSRRAATRCRRPPSPRDQAGRLAEAPGPVVPRAAARAADRRARHPSRTRSRRTCPFEHGLRLTRRRSASRTCHRVYQAFYTAFQGTGQKTVGRRATAGQPERGRHPDDAVSRLAGEYTGTENGEGVSSTAARPTRRPGTRSSSTSRSATRTSRR